MAIMKAAYPEHYRGMKLRDAEAIISLWTELLSPYPHELCVFALKRLITESPYAPKISDLTARVKELLAAGQENSTEAWNALERATERASIVTQAEFDALPYEARRFCGGLSGLRDMGNLDANVFSTVTRGQFIKAYDALKRSKETLELTPPEIREVTQGMAKGPVKRLAPKRLPKRITEDEVKEIAPETQERAEYTPLSESEWLELRDSQLAKLQASI